MILQWSTLVHDHFDGRINSLDFLVGIVLTNIVLLAVVPVAKSAHMRTALVFGAAAYMALLAKLVLTSILDYPAIGIAVLVVTLANLVFWCRVASD